MNTINHLFVLPITGPHQDKGRTCYVCQFGRAPVIVAFIKPIYDQLSKSIEYVQKMFDGITDLQALVVVLSGPEEVLIQKLRNLADEKKIAIPLSVLDPNVGLPDTITINPDANITLLLYRGKHFEKLGEISPGSPPKIIPISNDFSLEAPEFMSLDREASPEVPEFMALDVDAPPEISVLFREFDKAAKEMINRT